MRGATGPQFSSFLTVSQLFVSANGKAMFLRVIPIFLAPPLLELKIKGQKFSFQKICCHFLPHLL